MGELGGVGGGSDDEAGGAGAAGGGYAEEVGGLGGWRGRGRGGDGVCGEDGARLGGCEVERALLLGCLGGNRCELWSDWGAGGGSVV